MGRCAIQVIMGPAGSGKSTYAHTIQEHCANVGRRVYVANLDPAAEIFRYEVAFDIRDLISVTEVMEELGLGPNGGLIYCMEYLLENWDWLYDQLEENFGDDDYVLLDCPGQLELYTHVPIMKQILDRLVTQCDYRVASVFLLDATFICDISKFLSGNLLALSAMVALELPHVNILSKCDLLSASQKDGDGNSLLDDMLQLSPRELLDREQDQQSLLARTDLDVTSNEDPDLQQVKLEQRRRKRHQLTESICQLLEDYTMVGFLSLNIEDEDSLSHILAQVDHAIQYGEDLEVVTNDDLLDGDAE